MIPLRGQSVSMVRAGDEVMVFQCPKGTAARRLLRTGRRPWHRFILPIALIPEYSILVMIPISPANGWWWKRRVQLMQYFSEMMDAVDAQTMAKTAPQPANIMI
jgi:hypothetical protein